MMEMMVDMIRVLVRMLSIFSFLSCSSKMSEFVRSLSLVLHTLKSHLNNAFCCKESCFYPTWNPCLTAPKILINHLCKVIIIFFCVSCIFLGWWYVFRLWQFVPSSNSDMSRGSHFCWDSREGWSLENFWWCEWEFSDIPETLNLKVGFLTLIYYLKKWKEKVIVLQRLVQNKIMVIVSVPTWPKPIQSQWQGIRQWIRKSIRKTWDKIR